MILRNVSARFAPAVLDDAGYIAAADQDEFVFMTKDAFGLSEKGKPFVRAIAAKFDTYFGQGNARHSKAV